MERNEISVHEAKLFLLLSSSAAWVTSKEAATAAGIAERTSRAHLLKFTKLGIVDVAEVFPGHRYRMADKADKRNGGYCRRLEAACDVFGLRGTS